MEGVKMFLLPLLLLLVATVLPHSAQARARVTENEESVMEERYPYHDYCYYGNYEYYEHGAVAESMPECCLQLRCEDGYITKQYFNQPGDQGCCEFNGTMYANGSELPGFCWRLKCVDTEWEFTGCIDDCCGHCYVHTDPHFVTFDGQQYDFHGTCNHSLAQTKQYDYNNYYGRTESQRQVSVTYGEDWAYFPNVAVYSDFEPCFGGASCLDESTFKDNPNTVITMHSDSVFTLGVNGNSFVVPATGVHQVAFPDCGVYHPVLAFQYHGCTVLMGSSRITVMSCPYRLDVWAHPSHTDGLNGLCGLYSDYKADDFTDRFGHVHTLEQRPTSPFPASWMTYDQIDQQCLEPCAEEGKGCNANLQALPSDVCVPEDSKYQEALDFCKEEFDSVDLNDYLLESCAHDICVMRRNGNHAESQRGWLHTLYLNFLTAQRLETATECKAGDMEAERLPPNGMYGGNMNN